MTHLFLSHSHTDEASAAALRDLLLKEGYESVYLDFDPERGTPPGRNWEQEIYSQLRKSAAVVFLSSAASLRSSWCFAEIALARSMGKPVLPVAVSPGGAHHPLLRDVQRVDLTEGSDGARRLFRGLQELGLHARDSFVWDPSRSPYPGLESFTERDAAVFFGRDRHLERLLGLLEPIPHRATSQLVAVVGPSGSGKSSLVRAGLIPRLRRRPDRWLIVPRLVPGEHPTNNLARSLARAFRARSVAMPTSDILQALNGGPAGLVEVAEELCDADDGDADLVLVFVDQAEEMLSLASEHERAAFLHLVGGVVTGHTPLRIVMTIRSEFLDSLLHAAGVADLIGDTLLLGPLDRKSLVEVIKRPAERAGLRFEPESLVDRMASDTEGGDALPLLAYTLRQLYDRSGRSGIISAADYELLGGVVGALRQRADRAEELLAQSGLAALTLPVLTKFATVPAEGEPIRRRVRRDALSAEENSVVQMFIEARLLVSDGTGKRAIVEVAHEALLRQWPPLRTAINERREDLRLQSELERWAEEWRSSERRESYLLHGDRLDAAKRWIDLHGDRESELAAVWEFVRASESAAQAAVKHEAELLANRVLAGFEDDPELGILLACAIIKEFGAWPRAVLALTTALNSSRLRAVLVGFAAVNAIAWSPDGERLASASSDGDVYIWDTTRTAEPLMLHGHTHQVLAIAWSPSRNQLATASADKTVRVWTLGTAVNSTILEGYTDWINDITWSPDGSRLATAAGGTVRIWDVNKSEAISLLLNESPTSIQSVAWSPDGRRLAISHDHLVSVPDASTGHWTHTLDGHRGLVRRVAWSPDGTRIASAADDGTVRLWLADRGSQQLVLMGEVDSSFHDVAWSPVDDRLAAASDDNAAHIWNAQGVEEISLRGHRSIVKGLGWSPDGRRLATCSIDTTTRIWDVRRTNEAVLIRGGGGSIESVSWSPDGSLVATAGVDSAARLWDAQTGVERLVLQGHEQGVKAITWSADGLLLVTASADASVRLWDAHTGAELRVLHGHEREVNAACMSPDSQRIATASWDGSARVWDATIGAEVLRLSTPPGPVWHIAWSPDGSCLVTSHDDGTARIWRADSGELMLALRGHGEPVECVTWSPNGTALATASADHTGRVWSGTSGEQLLVLSGHEGYVRSIAWSQRGDRLATASDDRSIRVWDATSGDHLVTITGHEGWIHDVSWSPDDRRLVSASYDETCRIWEVVTDVEELLDVASQRVFRALTDSERQEFGLHPL